MSKRITKTYYTFRELIELEKKGKISSSAVESARQSLGDSATDGEWYDYEYELWKNTLNQIGFTDPDISFSGFCCQGDGASFTSGLDLEKLREFFSTPIEGKDCIEPTERTGTEEDFLPYVIHRVGVQYNPKFKELDLEELGGRVIRTEHRYSHYNTCTVEFEYYDNELAKEFEDAIEELREDLCNAIYKDLEEQYYALKEDENLLEFADGNEYYFDKNGEAE